MQSPVHLKKKADAEDLFFLGRRRGLLIGGATISKSVVVDRRGEEGGSGGELVGGERWRGEEGGGVVESWSEWRGEGGMERGGMERGGMERGGGGEGRDREGRNGEGRGGGGERRERT